MQNHNSSDALNVLMRKALAHLENDDFRAAIDTLENILQTEPDYIYALVSMSNAMVMTGQVDDALHFISRAQEQAPNIPEVSTDRLMLLHYSRAHNLTDIFEQTLQLREILNSKSSPEEYVQHDRTTCLGNKVPLRIGYLSADFRNHTIGHLFAPVLAAHNKDKFHTVLYSNSDVEDEITHKLRSQASDWRTITRMSDLDVVKTVLDDQIDILVDLSGYTDGGRLGVFKHKPAPLQMTWLGYFATTGLSEIDYIISDHHVLPEEDEKFYVERALRLPNTYFCFLPPPAQSSRIRSNLNTQVSCTFGCLNNIIKLNANVVRTWSAIIASVPNSRLILKFFQLSHNYSADNVRSLFQEHGIGPDQLILIGGTNRTAHLDTYQIIDIALDPFPFGGGITTLEALSMDVPVITMKGDRWVSRVSTSVLQNIGLQDCIAQSEEDYIQKAVKLACNNERLSMLRRNLGTILRSSPICNPTHFTKGLEDLYQTAWHNWCAH